jgi:DNA-binding transcriptional ArsR family regulator
VGESASRARPAVLDECRRLADAWAPVLRGMANPDRLLIVLWLADTSSTVRELEAVTGLRQSLVSYHLKALREAGLVTATAVGRANRYRLANPELNKLAELLGNSGIRPEQLSDSFEL